MGGVIFIIYCIASYMAINKVWYSKRTYLVFDGFNFFLKKLTFGVALGWLFIPIAIIMSISGK